MQTIRVVRNKVWNLWNKRAEELKLKQIRNLNTTQIGQEFKYKSKSKIKKNFNNFLGSLPNMFLENLHFKPINEEELIQIEALRKRLNDLVSQESLLKRERLEKEHIEREKREKKGEGKIRKGTFRKRKERKKERKRLSISKCYG